ncbi:MAG: YgiQ family radical SAM protein [Oligoflexia bacterium]|nr:YgiQ family radical SAM protein [Oligoflexia bacterium]MBF0364904.1 YgiQ family radical SAM protein [Oligoflexia bacterium]
MNTPFTALKNFLPTTKEELRLRGLDRPDIILVSGDTYIDSPFIGVSVIGRWLEASGFSVAIIAQPAIDSDIDIARLGEPKLFWGVTAGSLDSMVANYTALQKRRKSDDLTPGGMNTLRPDRATLVYSNLIKRYFKKSVPIVLGGVEASLRRISHYDYWSDQLKRSLLLDAKADALIYGMGERAVLQVAHNLKSKQQHPFQEVKGLCYLGSAEEAQAKEYLQLPSHQEVLKDKLLMKKMFETFYKNQDPLNAKGLYQLYEGRALIHNSPAAPLSPQELDHLYELPYTRELHPYYAKKGSVVANETIKFSITSHRGCYGECNYCAIAIHQGRHIISRSPQSIVREGKLLSERSDFKGYLLDVGGPTANMYGFDCKKKQKSGSCQERRCLYPKVCSELPINHAPYLNLLRSLAALPKVKKVFVASGIRIDLIASDLQLGQQFLRGLIKDHVSGQIKIAPEHIAPATLKAMGRDELGLGAEAFLKLKEEFSAINKEFKKKQFLTYYFIVCHPGESEKELHALQEFFKKHLHALPEQIQIFTPTPMTYSTLFYYTELDSNAHPLSVSKSLKEKRRRKELLSF